MAIDMNNVYRNGEEQAWKVELAMAQQNPADAQVNADEQDRAVELTDEQRGLLNDIDVTVPDWIANLTEEQRKRWKEIEEKLLPFWKIRLVYGLQGARLTFAVELTSRMYGGHSITTLEPDLHDKAAIVIRDLRGIGFFTQKHYRLLLECVDLLKELGLATEDSTLLANQKNFISKAEFVRFFESVANSILEHRDFFPSLVSHLYKDEDNFGVQLDTQKYRERYRLFDDNVQVFGVSSEFILQVLGLSDVREGRFRQIIRAWIEYGFIIDEGIDPDHKQALLKIGGKQVRLYLLRIDNFKARWSAIHAVEGFDNVQ